MWWWRRFVGIIALPEARAKNESNGLKMRVVFPQIAQMGKIGSAPAGMLRGRGCVWCRRPACGGLAGGTPAPRTFAAFVLLIVDDDGAV